ncbi:TrkH family potassium uptake protein [Paenibacillus thalictri]|uniref:Trk family potassium uptake protein n=1 Tax=Paenibacillus thalictri TaxID=2527873 RepID=A0A4Q9DKV1_9BACL|nr:TrkH family potassium uptake protein [Paenibacillus thalictri]TBL75388.1 Trk family potassium uptake protein [Paenibacillus thalictri]
MIFASNSNKFKYKPNPPQVLALGFVAMILIGSVLLSLSAAFTGGESLRYLDALFMAASAVCVTGLSVINPGTHLSTFGQIVLIVLVQIGGLGFMSMTTFAALVLRKRISFSERLILQEAINYSSNDGLIRLIRKVILYALAIEAAGAFMLALYLMNEMPLGQAVYFGVFHSISIFNNAGFDLFGVFPGRASSLIPYVDDPFVNIVSILLIFFGGIGFTVISELLTYPQTKKLSLNSKVVLYVSGLLIVVGTVVIFIMEFTNPLTLQPLSPTGKIFGALFQSVSSRSAGVNTLDPSTLRQSTQFFIILLMFIGAAPGSTGGGIKVTTFAVLVGAMVAMLRGRQDIVMFRSRIPEKTVYHAVTFTIIAFVVVVGAAMALSITERAPFLTILFEATSAFGTTGMSLGITPNLTPVGKILLIFLMFLGRLGPVTFAFALNGRKDKQPYRYPEGKITLG